MIDLLILIKKFKKFKTTSSTGGLHIPKRVWLPAYSSTGIKIWQRINLGQPRIAAVFFPYLFLYPQTDSFKNLYRSLT